MNPQPPAILWASVFVDELVRCGVKKAIVAPGSRSTALALALAAHPKMETLSLLDERGAGFFALGLGLATGFPAVLVCTSGTAAANFFPAVIEAAQGQVPLLVLTADRPHELRESGANQTIDQVRLYGAYPRWFQDMPLPEREPSDLTLRYLRITADRAVQACLNPVPGPVHINFPFRKPFEPDQGVPFPFETGRLADDSPGPMATFHDARQSFQISDLELPPRTLIVAGPRCLGGEFPAALAALSRKTGFPILADGLSGLRFGPWVSNTSVFNPLACRGVEPPDLLLQFGAVPTSQALSDFLADLPGRARRIAVQPAGTWHDDVHTTRELVTAEPQQFCQALSNECEEKLVDFDWLDGFMSSEAAYWKSLEQVREQGWFEGLLLPETVQALPDGTALFVANSNSVRHLEEFVRPSNLQLNIFANRGASGIDGNLSTAFGLASGLRQPIVAVCGDLAFYHDLNGLLALNRLGIQAVIVLINNNGGGIFRRLPVSGHDPAFTDLFLTPHGLNFEPAAALFGIEYLSVEHPEDFPPSLRGALGSARSTIIECRTDSAVHERARRTLLATYEKRIHQGDQIDE